MIKLDTIKKIWNGTSLILFNTCIIFILLNFFIAFLLLFRPYISGPITYGDKLSLAYPNMSKSEIRSVLSETWNRPQVYEPYVEFREEVYDGNYLNILSGGFFTYRNVTSQCIYPLNKSNYNIFVFGGSTVFGYGLADWQTIPYYLQQNLSAKKDNVCVYNLAQGSYFSTQEKMLFSRLIAENIKPDLAIFIDGLNEYTVFNNEPFYTSTLRSFMDDNNPLTILRRLPLIRMLTYMHVQNKMNTKTIGELTFIANNYIANSIQIQAIGNSNGVNTIFFIQPIPLYDYNLSYHFLYDGDENYFARHNAAKEGYLILRENTRSINNINWLGDIQQNITKNLYIDQVHYTAEFNKNIAYTIASMTIMG